MAFAAALLVPVDVRQEPMDQQQLHQEYPGSVPRAVLHPAAVGLLIAPVIVIIVVGVVVGLAAAGLFRGRRGNRAEGSQAAPPATGAQRRRAGRVWRTGAA